MVEAINDVSATRRRKRPSARDERGQGLVEYALIIALVGLASVIALGFLSGKINTIFSKAGNVLNNAALAGPGGASTGGPVTSPPTPGTVTISCEIENSVCADSGSSTQRFATANPGTWGGNPAPTLTYQWAVADPSVTPCDTATGGVWSNLGTGTTQLIPNIDDIDLLRVIVTGTNSAGTFSQPACAIFGEN